MIPRTVEPDELLVRGVLTPFHYSVSSGKLKREALLPPSNRQDVSLLRHLYTSDDFCKEHSKSLAKGNGAYFGLALLICKQVAELQATGNYQTSAQLEGWTVPSLFKLILTQILKHSMTGGKMRFKNKD